MMVMIMFGFKLSHLLSSFSFGVVMNLSLPAKVGCSTGTC